MKNNKLAKGIINGICIAALAVVGITGYQLSTAQKSVQESTPQESAGDEGTDAAAAGTDQVQADIAGAADGEDYLASAGDAQKVAGAADSTIIGLTGTADSSADNSADLAASADSTSPASDSTAVSGTDVLAQTDTAIDGAVSTDTSLAAYTAPEINFSEDTLMEWPVNGNILVDYSMDTTTYFATLDQYKLSPAIAVQAVEGAPVVSAVNGTVFSIEDDAETGTTLTMELGNGYQAIYGQLTDLTVAEGDTVTKGTTIGYIAAPTKYYSAEGSNLYFAMKKDGQPIDPILYLP